jgi:response regulator of citrate/malate metabolism
MISATTDETAIKALVQEHRQRVSMAQEEWETANDTKVSRATFRRFLKELADDINVSVSVAKDEIV